MLADGDSLIIHSYDRNPYLTGSGVRIVKLADLLGGKSLSAIDNGRILW